MYSFVAIQLFMKKKLDMKRFAEYFTPNLQLQFIQSKLAKKKNHLPSTTKADKIHNIITNVLKKNIYKVSYNCDTW